MFFDFVGNLDVAEAQLGQAVFYQALLFGGEIAFRLFLEDAEQVDRMARQIEIRFVFLVLFAKVHQSQMHLGLHQDGFHQKHKAGRRKRKVGSVFSVLSHSNITMLLRSITLKESSQREARPLPENAEITRLDIAKWNHFADEELVRLILRGEA